MSIEFHHRQSAHCETGVISNLLYHQGIDISEALVFGIGSGLFFGYVPFIRLNYLPLTTYRINTGGIFKRVSKRLGIDFKLQTYRNTTHAMIELDHLIKKEIPVGCQTGGYWLPYFPPAYRFHFNMHNLVVYGKNDGNYMISDPVFPNPVVCSAKDLAKARFSKGAMAPKGKMYYVKHVPGRIDFPAAIRKGIKEVCRTMRWAPGPILGVKGIRYLAKQIQNWPEKYGTRKAALHLGHVIRMQEEIGTGGGGFRFMYAAFLQEAADRLGEPKMADISEEMTAIGDLWRKFAILGARNCKKRATDEETYPQIVAILKDCAEREEQVYRDLAALVKKTD
jgi:hypothetical protein